MMLAGLLLVGAALLAVGAWWASRQPWGHRPSDHAPSADLRSLKELQARARRFDSGMDRTRGEKRGENNTSRINVMRDKP